MNHRRIWIRLLLGVTAVATAQEKHPESISLTGDFAHLIENKTLQGVSIGVIQNDVSTTEHAGRLQPDAETPPDDQTIYEIGSISKVFTALLLADAVVRGEVTLETPISQLLPKDVSLPNGAGEVITLKMLATHTSGLPRIPVEIPTDNYVNPYSRYGEADLWNTLRRVKLDFEPGTRANYSNLAAGLLGTLLARKAGRTYEQLLTERITGPLGMKDTCIELNEGQRRRFAPPFTANGELGNHWDFDALVGAGGIRSSLTDMMRFARAMLHPAETPLQRSIELAWSKQDVAATLPGLASGGQALGWMVAGDGATRWHNGMTAGFHSALFVNRELGIAVIFLSNRSTPVGTQLTEALFRRVAGMPAHAVPNRDRTEVALTAQQIDRCTGTFRLDQEKTLVCERRNLALYVTPAGRPTDRLYSASSTTFFSRRAPVELVFELPSDGGPATAVLCKTGNKELRALRE